jgi:hypothetical protein
MSESIDRPGSPPAPVGARPGVPIPPRPLAARRPRQTVWLVLAGAAAVLVLVVGTAFVAFGGGGSGGPSATWADPAREAVANEYATAATILAEAPAARYKGVLVGDRGVPIPVEVRITNEGVSDATLTVGGETVEVVTAGEFGDRSTYVKATEAFWRSRGAATTAGDYAGKWVKSAPDVVGADVSVLAPGALARRLDPGDRQPAPEAGPPATVNGVEARPMRAGDLVAWVSTAAPHRVVRVTAGDPTSDPSSPAPRGSMRTAGLADDGRFVFARAPLAGFELDVTELTEPETDDFFKVLEERLRGLVAAVDSQVRFALTGQITLAPCSTGGCQANVTIGNRVDVGSPYLKAQRPVNATVTIAMTLDGRPVNTCVNPVTMPPNGSASTACWASYYIPPSRNPRTHQVYATARAVAQALVQADVDKLISDLKKERERNRPVPRPPQNRPTVAPSAKPSASGSPSPSASDPAKACKTPFYDLQGDAHTRDGHFTGGANYDPNLKSRWYDDVDLQDLVLQAGWFKPVLQPGGRCAWTGNAHDYIGELRITQARTKQYTVITLLNGKLWTMHPGRP